MALAGDEATLKLFVQSIPSPASNPLNVYTLRHVPPVLCCLI